MKYLLTLREEFLFGSKLFIILLEFFFVCVECRRKRYLSFNILWQIVLFKFKNHAAKGKYTMKFYIKLFARFKTVSEIHWWMSTDYHSLMTFAFSLSKGIFNEFRSNSFLLVLLMDADGSKSYRWFDCSVRVRNVGFTVYNVADDFVILFNKKGKGFDMILTFPKLMSAKVLICSFLWFQKHSRMSISTFLKSSSRSYLIFIVDVLKL